MKAIHIAVALWTLSTPVLAQSSKDYAMMAKRSFSEFSCAALAATAGMKGEHSRLFKLGYEHGKTFIEALQANKVEPSDVSNIVPWGFSFNLGGPSPDFMLGVIWSFAIQGTDDGVRKDEEMKPVDPSLWEMRAKNRFSKENCSLL